MQPYVIDRRTDFRYVSLIDENNGFHDKIFVGDARDRAQNAGLNLVCFNLPQQDKLAFCKIIDYGKWKYQNEKGKKKDKSNSKPEVKEVRFSPVIDAHDIEHKLKQVFEFLDDGDEVILSMRFKGIQKRQFALGEELMDDIVRMCLSHGEEVSKKKADFTITVRLKPINRRDK